MAKRDQDVHFLASKEEVERIHQKMDELGIRSMGAYLRKMALDGYCINLDLQDVKAVLQPPNTMRRPCEWTGRPRHRGLHHPDASCSHFQVPLWEIAPPPTTE